jgi:hypothetical protein
MTRMSISSLIVTSPASVPASALRRAAARRFGALGHRAHDDDDDDDVLAKALAEIEDDEYLDDDEHDD